MSCISHLSEEGDVDVHAVGSGGSGTCAGATPIGCGTGLGFKVVPSCWDSLMESGGKKGWKERMVSLDFKGFIYVTIVLCTARIFYAIPTFSETAAEGDSKN